MKKSQSIREDSDPDKESAVDSEESERLEYWNRNIPWTFQGEELSYDEKRRLRYSLQDYMHHVIDFGSYKSKLLIELGSGGGIDSAEFASQGAEVVSVDFTRTGSRTTQTLLKSASVPANVVRSSVLHLPFQESRFDCVYSFGVLHHMPEIDRVLKEAARILKPNGDIICMLYNRSSLLYCYSILWMHRNEGLDESALVRRYSERVLGCPYTKAYSKQEALNFFSRDFDDVRVDVRYNVIDLPNVRKFKLNIPDDYELGWHLIVKGKRKAS